VQKYCTSVIIYNT